MIQPPLSPARTLEVRRTFATPREKVFAAWTQPDVLRKWWGVAEGYTTPVAEVDLRVGGSYRFGMRPPNDETVIVLTGIYRVIQPPERLVFTWRFENDTEGPDSLITLRFLARGGYTEVVLTHEYQGTEEQGQDFKAGWEGLFERLGQAIMI